MSVQWVSWVLTNERHTKGTDRLVLLVLAEHSRDGRGMCWPSVGRIAEQANVAERAVQRSLVKLKEMGVISIDRQSAPLEKGITADRRPNLYTIHRDDTGDTSRGDAGDTPNGDGGDAGGRNGVTPVTNWGDAGDTQTVREPTTEPSLSDSVVRDRGIPPEMVEMNVGNARALRAALHLLPSERAIA